MDDVEPEPAGDQEPSPIGGMRTQCGTCRGEGVVVVARMAVINGKTGSAPEVRTCPSCDGSGWIPGLIIPT